VDPENAILKKSAAMLESDVITHNPKPALKAAACYMAGLNYQRLGDYLKAAEAFASSYQADSKFMYADFCLASQGYCYERLIQTGKISEREAKERIRAAYSKLMAEYPASISVPQVQKWLHENQ
jgi:hypothetical protein